VPLIPLKVRLGLTNPAAHALLEAREAIPIPSDLNVIPAPKSKESELASTLHQHQNELEQVTNEVCVSLEEEKQRED
jgi:hypothetical protein